MKVTKTILLICAIVCGIQPLLAQNLSNKGKKFWVGYGHHQFMEPGQPNSQEMVLYLSAEQAANVTVTIFGTAYVRNYSVPANSVIATEYIPKSGANDARLISLPCSFVPPGFPCGGEGIFSNKGIYIESDVPIVAYAHIFGSASSGASMLMPVETWGYSYVSINSTQSYAANCFSWVYAIAQHDNTLIEVTPAATTRAGQAAGIPFTVNLMKGQIYQVMAGPETGSAKPEMTGTKIKSIANASGNCYPIAVFSGSSRTSNPMSCGSGGGDNDNQQCFPSQAWGKRYLTAPTSNSVTASTPMTNKYKIAVKDPATLVYKDGVLMTGILNNSYYEITSNEGHYITSDKPVMVAQFMSGGSGCQGGGGVGDPEMIYLSPVEQGIKRVGFYRNTRQGITVNYLTLIIPTAGLSSLTIDGSSTFNHTYTHPKLAGYTVVIKRWTAAQAQAVVLSDSAFTAITYGLGSVESYGYNAGTLINNLSAVGSIFNTSDTTGATTHPYTCSNTPVELSVLIAYQPTKLVWQLSEVGAVLSPNADVTVNSPVSAGTVTINGILYYKYTLPGNYNFSTTGNYTIPLLSTHPSIENCNNTESLNYVVQVNSKPSVSFTYNHTGCISDPVQFTSSATTSTGAAINQWLWTYPGAATSNTQDATHIFTTTGNQTVRLNAVSSDGCISDTTRTIPIFAKPVATITATPAAVCEGGSIALTGATTFGGSAPVNAYYWNFGNGTANTSGPHTVTYPASGTYNVKFVAGVSAACMSDTAVKVVQVSPKPNTTFTYPAGCLPANGVVQFTGSSMPGQTYLWNFGDPASGAANTSTLANPSHTYPTFGNYTISYSVTNATGCTKDTTVNATFNLSPSFSYPALAPVCASVVGTVSVASATVTNGVPGTGIYRGPATTTAGVFTPSLAGAGSHTIWFVYAATSGCTDSISQTITVYPKPAANFTIASSTCLPASGTVQFNYTGTVSAGQTYAWNFGDPASGAANTSALPNPTHNYITGNFSINLVVTNAQGCVDDTTYNATFSRRAALAYQPLSPVCVSTSGTVSVASATVTNGVTGNGIYSGPGTNAAGDFTPSLAGAGTHTIKYIFTATGNCVDSTTSTITVFPKPTASFNYPTGCLASSGAASFTYAGSAVNSYAWNFGDPASGASNLSSLQNPTHNFTTAGNYALTLTVSDANACTDDTVINAVFNLKPALNYPTLPPVCSSVPGTISVSTATVTNGVTGSGIYKGPGTDAAGNFNPSIAGPGTHTIWYVFTAGGNCKDSVSTTINVGAKPNASFTYAPTTVCLPSNGSVQFTYTGSAAASYAWNFGDPSSGSLNTSTLQNPIHVYSNTGTYNLSLIVTGTNGCTDDTILTRQFSVTPALNFPTLPTTCEGASGSLSVATASVTNGVSGTGIYRGPGTDASGNFNPALAGAGTHAIWYVFTSTGNCKDSISSTITVNAKPTASFTYTPTTACLPATGMVQFNASSSNAYTWNFGDPASGAANASSLQNPSHSYSNTGTYNVSLVVTGANGCTDDTVITRVFSVTPDLIYPPLPTACGATSGTISVATATVTNGVAGSGVYSGPGTDAAGNFNASVAGPGTHTILYTFTSTGNCVATKTSTITVRPTPTSAFTATNNICDDEEVLINDNSTIASGSIVSWKWNFGDNTSATYTSNTAFTHDYLLPGTYLIRLVTTSDNGCVSDTATQSVSVHAVPLPNFTMPVSVCLPGGAVAFQNTSTISDNAALTYQWNFGDLATSTAVNPTHTYLTGGSYDIRLTVTSQFGCVKDTIKTFANFFDKPIASFTASPDNLCQGSPVVFTNASTAPNSSVTSNFWNFGEGTTSGVINPVKTFTAAGTFDVRLSVKSNEGCISDTTSLAITVNEQPVIDAGPSFVVAEGTLIQFQAVSNSTGFSFLWTPAAGLSDAAILKPTYTANANAVFTLTATGNGSCTATDTLTVKVLRTVSIPNAFSPNGDGVNDTWRIDYLNDYPGAAVHVYNRYGQSVYSSNGYVNPWDGTIKGKPLPVATYYYIIDLKNGFKSLNGPLTIIR